jgi:hypothetical protein
VRGKGLSWPYLARATPKARREPCPACWPCAAGWRRRSCCWRPRPTIYFDDDHYRGYPAVLVRLEAIGEAELARCSRRLALLAPKSAGQADRRGRLGNRPAVARLHPGTTRSLAMAQGQLAEYRRKRDFQKTAEPSGDAAVAPRRTRGS